jgi:hypothetical protein
MAKTNPSPTFPAYPGDAAVVTPSDTVSFEPSVLYVGVTGNLRVTTAEGSDVLFPAVPAGFVLPVRVTRVWATNTVASSIVRVF